MPDDSVHLKDGPPACNVCGSIKSRRVQSHIRGTEFDVYRCAGDCGVEFLSPQPTWEQIRAIYDASYYKAWGMAEGEVTQIGQMKRHTFARCLRQTKRYVPGGKILDVGTASGFFLEVAQAGGFEPFGVEVSEYSGNLAAEKFGRERIHIGTLESAPFAAGTFNAVAMSDLIEHVSSPVETLTSAARLLRPGGVLLVMTPNRASLTHALMGKNWTHYKLEHLFYFDHRSLSHAARKSGLEIVYFRPAVKTLTLRYVHSQFATYRHWLLTPLVNAAHRLTAAQDWPLPVIIGEFVAVLRKP
jgi:2-polyprenyl-3-methyl-5-hydroxy-6-metoxy-1,4-benzoquinol methylase